MAGDLIRIEPPREAHMLPSNFDEAREMAGAIARSNLFGCKTSEQAFALMLLADAEGLHPAAAARDYHIVDGKPSLKADAMLARYMAAGGKIKWLVRTDTKVSAEFTHASSGSVTITWDEARAKTAGLWGKHNWKSHPQQMLSARVISEGVRASFPGVVSGVYTPEEVQDFDEPAPRQKAQEVIIEPNAGPQEIPPPATQQATGGDDPSPASPPVQTMTKAQARPDFTEIVEEIRATQTGAELADWGKRNIERVQRQPRDFQVEIRKEYESMMQGFKHLAETQKQADAALTREAANGR